MTKTMPLDEFMAMTVDHHRNHLVQAFAAAFREPCPVCEGTHYLGDACGVPMCDEKDSSNDCVDEFILFVCASCGTVFNTYELDMHTDCRITGKLEAELDDPDFIREVQASAGYEPKV